ncbi:nucleotidyltransferase domain-containing protein [Spirosoma agri]|uniref:Nucleotidyltransferase domain-containing protein n=1 Tax=Spirosoma agri TaxID=1987381 RepID=A0A6M0IMJ5_9BACT|nr:nucleotidyltransferase domain-containing protein [Spirosoma agri]NEU69448.1 nucleotidyltransferase domain-containing protein [Spirosoma agri]
MKDHLLPFQSFIDNAIALLCNDPDAIGLAVGGSWITGAMDAYSDLDLVLITANAVAPDENAMRAYASRFGTLLSSFRGDHVGEPRLLIALYESPLLHVDIKFLTIDEFDQRVEDPVIVWERDGALTSVLQQSQALYPPFDYQRTEDRFWIWMHYAALKVGRGEYFEAMDFLSFVRNVVLGPMLHLKKGSLPRGVRRLETIADPADLVSLIQTIATPDRNALVDSLQACVRLYLALRDVQAPAALHRNDAAQKAVMTYLTTV